MPLKGWRNNMIDLKDEKRDIYDYFDLIDQAKTKKETKAKQNVYKRSKN